MDLMTNHLKILVEDMHSAIVATVDKAGRLWLVPCSLSAKVHPDR